MKKEQLQQYDKKISLIMLLVGLFFIGGIVITYREVHSNEDNSMEYFKTQQQVLGDEIAERLSMIASEKKSEDIVQEVVNCEIQGGRRWLFLYQGENILYLRNQTITKSIQVEKKQPKQVIEDCIKNKMVVTEHEFLHNGSEYGLVIATERSMVLIDGKITNHTNYILLLFLIICLVCMVIVITLLGMLKRKNHQYVMTQQSLVTLNEAMDRLSIERLKQRQLQLILSDTSKTTLDRGMFYSLIGKSERLELKPCTILLFYVKPMDCSLTEHEIESRIEKLRSHLSKRCIFIRMDQQEYMILAYRMPQLESIQLENQIRKYLSETLRREGMNYCIRISREEHEKKSLRERFEYIYGEIQKIREEEQ